MLSMPSGGVSTSTRVRPRGWCWIRSAASLRCSGSPVGRTRRLPGWSRLPQPFQAVYEAGPTGYGLARAAREHAAWTWWSARPGISAKNASDRIKTDRRDAERLARLLLAGELQAGTRAGARRGAAA